MKVKLQITQEKLLPPNVNPYLIFFKCFPVSHIINYVKSVHIQEFFWSAFSRIQTEYRDLQSKGIYRVNLRI